MVETPGCGPGGSRFESDRSHCEGTGCSGVSYALHAGSIPALATNARFWAGGATGSAAPLQGEGCGFESRAVHRETSRADVAQRKRHGAQNAVSAGSNPAVSTTVQQNPPGRGATEAHRLREPGVGSSNLSVQTRMRGGGSGTTPDSESGGPGSSPGLAATRCLCSCRAP